MRGFAFFVLLAVAGAVLSSGACAADRKPGAGVFGGKRHAARVLCAAWGTAGRPSSGSQAAAPQPGQLSQRQENNRKALFLFAGMLLGWTCVVLFVHHFDGFSAAKLCLLLAGGVVASAVITAMLMNLALHASP